MPTIDAQVHACERDHSGRPWAVALDGRLHAGHGLEVVGALCQDRLGGLSETVSAA